MYAVIDAGGKQERVEVGELVDVELLGAEPGDELQLRPLLVVDGQDVVSSATALAGASVTATVVGEAKGPKIVGFTYKSKTRQRRRYGHRQRYTTLEITAIAGPPAAKPAKASPAKGAKPAKATAAKATAADASPAKADSAAKATADEASPARAAKPAKASSAEKPSAAKATAKTAKASSKAADAGGTAADDEVSPSGATAQDASAQD